MVVGNTIPPGVFGLRGERGSGLAAFTPQFAARLARAVDRWFKLAEPFRTAAQEAIKRVAAKADLSNDVREVVSRALSN